MSKEDRSEGSPSGARPEAEVDPEAATQVADGRPPSPSGESDQPGPTEVMEEDAAQAAPDRSSELDEAATVVRARESGAGTTPSTESEPELGPSAQAVKAEAPAAPPAGIAPGSVLFGEYEIVEVLGAGGMGEVYRARHRRLDEFRAIKMMHAELASKQGANEFFLREAKALLAVRHPAVVHCHDLLSDESGRVFLVMEMIEGVPLGDRLAEGPVPADQVALLGARLAAGLRAAHACGVVHRDVSPDNVVLPDGDVEGAKLIDFGIAKILEEGQGTIVDGFKGKLSYASPEQLGFFGGRIDGRSDFYSLGLVLCAAALGRPMGMGTTVVEAVDARRSFQRVPDQIPVGLRSSIEPLLALDPRDRPENPSSLFVAAGGDQPGLEAIRAQSLGRSASVGGGSAGWLRGAAAVLALVLAAVGFWLYSSSESAAPRRDTPSTAQPEAAGRPGSEVAAPVKAPTAPVEPAPAKEATASSDVTAKKDPAPSGPSRLEALRIMGLLRGAELALAENRLQNPPGDNAYEKYRAVLELDPKNAQALRGLETVAGRYIALSERALARGDVEQARDYVARAASIAPEHAGLEAAREAADRATE